MVDMQKKYTGSLFGGSEDSVGKKDIKRDIQIDKRAEALIQMQADLIRVQYNAVCLDVDILKNILHVGETNVYDLLNSGDLHVTKIGGRKIVSVASLAEFLILGQSR